MRIYEFVNDGAGRYIPNGVSFHPLEEKVEVGIPVQDHDTGTLIGEDGNFLPVLYMSLGKDRCFIREEDIAGIDDTRALVRD